MKKHLLRALQLCGIFLSLSYTAMAQQATISGKVTDAQGLPLPGANILIKGTNTGQTANTTGNFSIQVNNKSTDILVFSMVGYTKKEVRASVSNTINVQLTDDNTQLNEVVVVGYGTQKRKDVTGSIASIKGDAFKNQPIIKMLH